MCVALRKKFCVCPEFELKGFYLYFYKKKLEQKVTRHFYQRELLKNNIMLQCF